jgi:hypothetical protein
LLLGGFHGEDVDQGKNLVPLRDRGHSQLSGGDDREVVVNGSRLTYWANRSSHRVNVVQQQEGVNVDWNCTPVPSGVQASPPRLAAPERSKRQAIPLCFNLWAIETRNLL